MEKDKDHILIVDDDDRIRNLLKDYLSENGYIVSSAENANQAKERMQYLQFEIIILDVMMPGQDGFELTKEIKKNNKIPIILLTAKGEVDNRIKGLELGADDYLGKPFEPKELLLRIKNIINKQSKIDFRAKHKVGDAEIDFIKHPRAIAAITEAHVVEADGIMEQQWCRFGLMCLCPQGLIEKFKQVD